MQEFDLLKELISTQVQSEVATLEDCMNPKQESLKDSLVAMIRHSTKNSRNPH